MRVKKLISALAVMTMTLSALAGCSAKTSQENPANSEEVSKMSESSTKESEGVVLTVYQGTAGYADMVEQICKDYKEETGVTLEWEK